VPVDLRIDADEAAVELVQFIARRIERAPGPGAVLGLSGGLDSTVVAFLAVRALGPQQVWPFILPYRTSRPESRRDAELIAKKLRLEPTVLDVSAQVDSYFDSVGEKTPLRVGNKIARERMSILYDHAKARGGLVLGSGNRTERLLGYTTLWGDMACDLAPLGGLYKTQVRQLAVTLGVPRQILEKTPTADLWPGQTDEGEIGVSYQTCDKILHLMVDRRLSQSRIVALGYELAAVRRIRSLMRASAHKRRLPPSPRSPR
jgi:NAD+ synthase